MSELFMTREETAKVLRLSLRTVDNLIVQGEIAIRRIGRRVLIPTAEIKRFAETKPLQPRTFSDDATHAVA